MEKGEKEEEGGERLAGTFPMAKCVTSPSKDCEKGVFMFGGGPKSFSCVLISHDKGEKETGLFFERARYHEGKSAVLKRG